MMLGEALSFSVYQCQDNVKLYIQAKFDEIFHAVQEFRAFSLKELNRPKLCSVKPRHRSVFQRLDNFEIHLYTKFEPNATRIQEE